ncbi:MAG: SusC/RagA family TonB-linked outer membrane protein [Bacteroidales bacterium]|nr:SusC/RagA family TonB-linked outer membrane protein [Bacteroidales bacterium]
MKKSSLFILMALSSLASWAQTSNIKGTVVDDFGDPVIGANVLIKGTTKGTVTNVDGVFELPGEPGTTIVISSLGMESQELTFNGQELNVILESDLKSLMEVVVIGYGTMDKKELTSAISHISEKDLLTATGADVSMMIQGKVPGVSITNTGVGDPNAQASIQIRGVSSRSAGTGPLIVIDGIAGGNLTNVNPNDIASFDILKDGAASAIYGTRGSNGVILITTKKGQKDGVMHTTYNGTFSVDKIIKELDMLDAEDYRRYGRGIDLGGSDNWFDEVSQLGHSMQHTLTISGGNQKSNYRASFDYRDAEGLDIRSSRREYGARLSVSHTTNSELFTFMGNVAPRIAYRETGAWDVFRNSLDMNPTTPIMDPEDPTMYYNVQGQTAGYNPVELAKLEKDGGETKLIDMDATVKLNLFPLLMPDQDQQSFDTQLTFADHQYDNFNYWFRPSNSTLAINSGRSGEASRSYGKSRSHSLEWLANYANSFGQNNVKLMLGYSYQYNQNSGMSADNKDFPNDGLSYNNLATGEYANEEGNVCLGSYKNDSKLIAFFGRLSYDFAGKYLFTASLRHEGSSRFGANNKWGNFPAVSAGWRISEENFMSDIDWINDLKIRGDYGVTGNQDFGSYLSLNTLSGYGYYNYEGKYFQVWGPSKNINPDLKWEKGKNWNVGIDFSILDNMISGSLNYYNRTQQDLLGNYKVSVPPYLFEETFVNVGTMNNSGFEFDLNFNIINNKNFQYSVTVVGATQNNKFTKFSNSEYVGQDYFDVCGTEDPYPRYNLQRIKKGERLGNFYMLKYAGINEDGEFVVYDKDGDLILASNATMDDYQVVGNGLPKFTGSMTHNFRYKNFDASVFLRGAFGYDIFNIHDFYYGTQSFTGNTLKKAYEKNKDIKGNQALCDYYLEKGDYLKLDMVTLGYTFDINAKYIDRVRVNATGKNLATFTGFSGIDPSNYNVNGLAPGAKGSRTYYPSCRQFILGIQVDF